ncbi:MAG: isopentenyl-diphosphate delta-isomerase, partial [Bacteroidetes bacterium]|nr:isopentenyl-diphosphate delta-isomerase [Bacteroidota bacterium]
MDYPFVILVDNDDNRIGISGKMEAHQKALLHRAVSVFIINTSGKWILQRRAFDKYHSRGLWTNTCCTHPQPG